MNLLEFEDLDKHLLSQNSKIIHQVWFGNMPNKRKAKKMYEKLKKYRDSWKIQNPTWCHIEWNKKMCNKFISSFFPEHLNMYKGYSYEIQRCDVVRYAILYRYGGLYADMDYYCCESFNNVFEKYIHSLYLVQTPNREGEYISNSLMFSKQYHPFWKHLLIELEINKDAPIYYSKHLVVMYTSGPGILNRVFHRHKNRYNLKSFPHKYFQPHTHTENIFSLKNSNVYAIHASNGCWHGKDSFLLVLLCKEWKFLLVIVGVILICFAIVNKL